MPTHTARPHRYGTTMRRVRSPRSDCAAGTTRTGTARRQGPWPVWINGFVGPRRPVVPAHILNVVYSSQASADAIYISTSSADVWWFRPSEVCDPGGEGCIASGTYTRRHGVVQCAEPATWEEDEAGARFLNNASEHADGERRGATDRSEHGVGKGLDATCPSSRVQVSRRSPSARSEVF